MAPSAILRRPNCESGRILWHLRHISVMKTSFPSASKMDDLRRLGRAGSPPWTAREAATGFDSALRTLAGATMTLTAIF
jgi:hypothetical protein